MYLTSERKVVSQVSTPVRIIAPRMLDIWQSKRWLALMLEEQREEEKDEMVEEQQMERHIYLHHSLFPCK